MHLLCFVVDRFDRECVSISVELYSNFPGSQSIEFFTVNTELTMFTVLALTFFSSSKKKSYLQYDSIW